MVKHLASVELGYFGDCFVGPHGIALPWFDDDAEANADMWATPDESREEIVGLYHQAWAHSAATIDALDLESSGRVRWWPPDRNEVSLHRILVHVATETHRHAGQPGLRQGSENLPDHDAAWWADYRARIEQAASGFRPG